jgi:hypothetical protein
MEEAIKKVADEIEAGYRPKGEDYSPLTKEAVRIADISLCSFTGELLGKGLAISKAIVEFEDELKKSTRQ